MTDGRSLERAARSWLEDGPIEAPDRAIEAALLQIQTTNQERDWHVPWRTGHMTQTTRLLAGAAVIVVLLVGGALLFRPGGNSNVGGLPSPPFSVSPDATRPASPSTAPSSSPTSSPIAVPPLTQSFTSARHGYTISLPSAWRVTAATAPWPAGIAAATPPDPMLDTFIDPGDATRSFVIVSQPLASGVTSDAWLTAYEDSAPAMPGACWPASPKMEKVTIDGQPASIHGGLAACGFTEAIAFAGGRVYELTANFQQGGTPLPRNFFDALLATTHFDPTAADDSPAKSPRPS
jgi:hypothetical protein